jgi:hypothetical protein
LTAPVIVVVIVVVPVTHPLVILTVSHVSPFIPALKLCSCRRILIASGRAHAHRVTMPFKFMSSISPTIAFSKDAFPTRRRSMRTGPNPFSQSNQPNRLA